jgi:hypothetical protein
MTPEVLLVAVNQNGYAFERIEKSKQTPLIIETALAQNADARMYVP